MRQIIAFLLFTFNLSSFAHLAPLSEKQFTEIFSKQLKQSDNSIIVATKSSMELLITRQDGKQSTIYLNNAYNQYLNYPDDLKSILATYIASYKESLSKEEGISIDRTRIVPIIKDKNWLAEMQESTMGTAPHKPLNMVYETLNDELVIIYAEDTPKNINYFSSNEFEKLNIPKESLRNLAVENIKKLIPKPEIKSGEFASMITAGGDYEASLLLFTDIWESMPKEDGEIIVAIPSRDLLFFTSYHNTEGVMKLREFAKKFAQESTYRLTDKLFIYKDGKFLKFE